MKSVRNRLNTSQIWLASSLIGLPIPSFARGSGVNFVNVIQNIIDLLTGDVARVTGVLAVVGAGYLYLGTQQMDKKVFVRIAVAMTLILGAPTLAEELWG